MSVVTIQHNVTHLISTERRIRKGKEASKISVQVTKSRPDSTLVCVHIDDFNGDKSFMQEMSKR